jgi:hypothetical protein
LLFGGVKREMVHNSSLTGTGVSRSIAGCNEKEGRVVIGAASTGPLLGEEWVRE